VEREKVKACIETRLFCKLFMEKIESNRLSKILNFSPSFVTDIFEYIDGMTMTAAVLFLLDSVSA
jgi:hypothetical protein